MAERGKRKTLVGVVAGDKMDKTVVVLVRRLVLHPVYKKYIKKNKKGEGPRREECVSHRR
jgi:small subunit ribosomal protein S17